MLAGDVCLTDGANLISNGNFETFINVETQNVVNSFATARFYDSESVSQWTVADGDGDGTQRINLLTFDNERGTVLDVDSIPNQDDRVFQDVEVTAGQEYLLTFDYFGPDQVDGVSDPATNDFEVYYNGELLGALNGVARFQKASFVITGAANDSESAADGEDVLARIEFRDGTSGDRGGDGRGALIDEVSLVAVTEATIVNGDFESSTVTAGDTDFTPDDVDGFSLFNFSDDAQPRVIQLQNDGDNNFLNLNSSSDLIDQVFQDFETEVDQAYFVTFDLRVDPTSDLAADELRVRFDNQFAANIVANDQWQSYGLLVEASSESGRLTFRESGDNSGDGASPQIDNLRFFRVDDVAPPVNDLVVDANGTAEGLNSEFAFFGDIGPQNIAPTLVISHESGTTLNFASIALVDDNGPLATESLSVQTVPAITAEYDSQTGILSLTGRAAVADYQSVIRSLTYENTGGELTNRLVGISVTDSEIGAEANFSPRTLIDVNIFPSATVVGLNDVELGFGQAFSLNLETSAVGFDDSTLTFEVTEAGALSEQLAVSDTNELILPVAAQAGSFDVTVVASDALGAQAEQTFTVNVAEFVPYEGVGALSNIPTLERNDIYTEAPPQNIDTSLTYDAVLDTSQGEIRIRLLDDESPTFVNNFVNLARDGFYDGLTFHRVIDGFVAQGGDPLGTGTGGPGFEIPDELDNEIEFDARGQLSFANAGNGTTGSQFFITFAPTFLNNNQFSVFGNVISGDAVLDSLARTQSAGSIPIPDVAPDVISSIRIEEV